MKKAEIKGYFKYVVNKKILGSNIIIQDFYHPG